MSLVTKGLMSPKIVSLGFFGRLGRTVKEFVATVVFSSGFQSSAEFSDGVKLEVHYE